MTLKYLVLFCSALVLISSENAFARKSFSMPEAVEYALVHSPAMKKSEENLKASESSLAAARSSFGPTAGVSYGVGRYSKERSSRYEKNNVTVSLKVTQPLFRGFELLNAYQKARLQKERQELQHEYERLSLAASVQSAFISYLEALASIKSDRRSLQRAENQLGMATAAWEIGLRPRLDVLQAEADRAKEEARLIRHENERNVWHAKLNSLLDIPQNESVEYRGDLSLRGFHRTLESCLRTAMARRPELLMARKSADIAGRDLGLARASFWPHLSAVAGWSSSGSGLGAAGSKYSRKDYSYAEAGISIEWTLFSSGKRIHLTRQAEHQAAAMEAAVREAIGSCGYQIRSAFLTVQDAYRSVEVSKKAAERAKAAYEDAKMRYQLQSASYLDTLSARSVLSEAELGEISSRGECLRALSVLYAGMGEYRPDLNESSDGRAVP